MEGTELIRAISFGIASVAYSSNNLVRCECHRRHQLFSLYFSRHYLGLTGRGVSAKILCDELSEIVGYLLWGRYLRVVKSDGLVLSFWR